MIESKIESSILTNWGEILSAACQRPQMFTGFDTLQSVLNFVGGYLHAQNLISPETNPEWREFNYWLAQKFGYPRNYGWFHAREFFSSDEEALKAFPLLLKEFRKEMLLKKAQHNKRLGRMRKRQCLSNICCLLQPK